MPVTQTIPFKSRVFTGGHKMREQREMLKEGVDVAICSPGRLKQLLEAGHLKLTKCQV